MTTGYAAVENGLILVDTIGSTRQKAIVNFLMTGRRIYIGQTTTSEDIEYHWNQHKNQADIVEVSIEPLRSHE